MTRLTAALTRRIAIVAIRRSWAILSSAERRQVRGERLEAWAHHFAVRWDCIDEVLSTLAHEALKA